MVGVTAQAAPRRLRSLLRPPRWERRAEPFAHIVGHDVFKPKAYAEMEADFRSRLDPDPGGRGFSRVLPTADATALLFGPGFGGPLSVFLSQEWHDLVAGLAGVTTTRHVSGGLHHRPVGSVDNEIHNDLDSGWFDDRAQPEGIVVADHSACRYGTGAPRRPGVQARHFARGVSVLFYLANPPWTEGDGGVTGLFHGREDALDEPVAIVPPVNNTALIFECTPHSFHAFLTNTRNPRNSVAMWLHREVDGVAEQWGPDALDADRRVRPRVS